MIYRRAGARFPENALVKSLIGQVAIGSEFQGDMPLKPKVLRAVDYAHPTASYFADDPIMRNCLSRQTVDYFVGAMPLLRLARTSHQDGPSGVVGSAAHGLCRTFFDGRFSSPSSFTDGGFRSQQRTDNGELTGGWKVAETAAARTDSRFSIGDCHK
jgi:hypothetical protein